MKKISLLFGGLTLLLYSCREKKPAPSPAIKDPNYVKAKSFLGKQTDSAFYYFNQVAIATKDSLQTSNAYNYMAYLQSEEGDHLGSEENLTMSLRYLDTANRKNYKSLASTFNELGLTSIRLSNYQDAFNFFEKAIHFSAPDKYRLVFLNNKALAAQKKGAYAAALQIYRKILPQIKDQETYARVLSNMARTEWLLQKSFKAAPQLLTALRIRLSLDDQWGLNASYSHLADYYQHSRPDSALYFASSMYVIAQKISSPDDQLNALDKLIVLSSLRDTKAYFIRYQKLNDSLQTARNAAKNRFAYIRYQVERKEADNLKLQKENAEKQYQIGQRNILLLIGLLASIILAGAAVLWYRKRKHLQDEEKRQAVQETQRSASKKVHDTLANDIYRIMKKIQHDTGIKKEWLLDNIDDVYKRSRDISYDIVQDTDTRFHEKIAELLKSFATDETKVVLVGNDAELWQRVDPAYQFELKYVLQELMVNMQKHSKATNVVIKFAAKEDEVQVTYFDNGIGFDPSTVQMNGLQNTGNRINGIGGQITFDSGAVEGLSIQIVFPAV